MGRVRPGWLNLFPFWGCSNRVKSALWSFPNIEGCFAGWEPDLWATSLSSRGLSGKAYAKDSGLHLKNPSAGLLLGLCSSPCTWAPFSRAGKAEEMEGRLCTWLPNINKGLALECLVSSHCTLRHGFCSLGPVNQSAIKALLKQPLSCFWRTALVCFFSLTLFSVQPFALYLDVPELGA